MGVNRASRVETSIRPPGLEGSGGHGVKLASPTAEGWKDGAQQIPATASPSPPDAGGAPGSISKRIHLHKTAALATPEPRLAFRKRKKRFQVDFVAAFCLF